MTDPVLTVTNASFSYREACVVDGVSFSVHKGEYLAVIGPNGSGKTTLLRLAGGLLKPSGGQILLEGEPVSSIKKADLAKRLAFVPQGASPVFSYTCLETVLMGLFPRTGRFGLESQAMLEMAESVMKRAGCWSFAGKSVQEISGGEFQRVILARALAQLLPLPREPDRLKLLLLDEAMSDLDICARFEMMELVLSVAQEYAIGVAAIHHDLHMAGLFARTILALKGGKAAAFGPAEEVLTEGFFRGVFGVKAEKAGNKGFLFLGRAAKPQA
jgi:iron complex transport system ATP-binding protein